MNVQLVWPCAKEENAKAIHSANTKVISRIVSRSRRSSPICALTPGISSARGLASVCRALFNPYLAISTPSTPWCCARMCCVSMNLSIGADLTCPPPFSLSPSECNSRSSTPLGSAVVRLTQITRHMSSHRFAYDLCYGIPQACRARPSRRFSTPLSRKSFVQTLL